LGIARAAVILPINFPRLADRPAIPQEGTAIGAPLAGMPG
jgi:hypothetical protein